ncbi:MAG: hypothetical protein AAF304_06190 [Pseudomonadota bacterium]
MEEYPKFTHKGYTCKALVKVSNKQVEEDGTWYEYSVHGEKDGKECIVKGPGLYQSPGSAAEAAISFAKREIDEHLAKYEKSFFYRFRCSLGYCPAARGNPSD